VAGRRRRSRDARTSPARASRDSYATVLAQIAKLITEGRRSAVRAVDDAMTTTYWLIGRRIVEAEQRGVLHGPVMATS
jgi:hypothetical protein